MAELQQYKGGYYLRRYVPSLAAAALFALLFIAITVAHFWRLFRTRMWFCLPFAIGDFCKSTNRCDENIKAKMDTKVNSLVIAQGRLLTPKPAN
jgi:hypothetical protein